MYPPTQTVHEVIDLLEPEGNILLRPSYPEAAAAVRSGNVDRVQQIEGQFAICAREGKTVRMARSIGRPMRYFLAKRAQGPCLIVAERIDEIHARLAAEGLQDQFHPSYTRMVPAHHILELQLIGCPDPNPELHRYFAPPRNTLPADIPAIGLRYMRALQDVLDRWLETLPADAPIGVLFSGGVDSGSLILLLHDLMLRRGQAPQRLKAFTLSVEGQGSDLAQARQFLQAVGLEMLLEVIEVPAAEVDYQAAVRVIEDYKPLDVQAATMGLALCGGIRRRYPEWKYLVDGDGGDENLKDYPIEENPELTIRSVLGNRMLYQEGWGVDAVKHSLTYSGGQSRGHVRTSAPAAHFGFHGFSPYAVAEVIEVAEAIPFVQLTDWQHEKLYALKGQIVAAGIEQLVGQPMPRFAKQRFQRGAAGDAFDRLFPTDPQAYRQALAEIDWDARAQSG